jgi:hypothetical protein
MRIIQKADLSLTEFYHRFGWINFDKFRDSDGYGFLLYFSEEKSVTSQDLIAVFHTLFDPFLKDIIFSLLEPSTDEEGGWGDFCLETWSIQQDTYNYSPQGKSPETARYLEMLQASHIEPSFNGLGYCQDWDQFLSVILDCIMAHKTFYSFDFYNLANQFMFYFHHTGSLGIFYHKFNDAIMHILQQAKAAQLELWNWDDEETLARLRGDVKYRGKR